MKKREQIVRSTTETEDHLAEELKRTLQDLADRADEAARPQVRDAALDLISAINYEDEKLVDSTSNSLLAATADVTRDSIARELSVLEGTKEGIKEGWARYVNKKAYDLASFDELRDLIESMIDARIASLTKSRELAKLLKEHDHLVENAKELEEGIRDLRRFREGILKNWPAPKPPSPLNRERIAEARAALGRKEGWMRQDDLVWREKPQ